MAKLGNLTCRQPFNKAVAVTKSDETVLALTDALWVGDGNATLAVVMADGTTASFAAVPDGTLLEVAVTKVLSTGTDAANILALYY